MSTPLSSPPTSPTIFSRKMLLSLLIYLYVKDERLENNIYEEICKLAVQEHGYALEYVKDERFSNNIYEEICKLAVYQNGLALYYINEDKQTDEIIDIALQQNINAKKYIKIQYDENNYGNYILK
jgi:hypothetical protein